MALASGTQPKIFFIGFVGSDYSRSSTIFNTSSTNSVKIYREVRHKFFEMIFDLTKMRNELTQESLVVVMSPCQKLTVASRVLLKRKIYLDAGWPLVDGILSRGLTIRSLPKLAILYFLDLASLHSSAITFVESRAQLERVNKIFWLPRARMRVGFTGFNETSSNETSVSSEKVNEVRRWISENSFKTIVMFRGRVNLEAGIGTILEAARELKSETGFIFLIGSKSIDRNLSENCHLIVGATVNEMRQLYDLADITLGQISNHSRLTYSIPHKAFEAGYFAKCYITTKTNSILELYQDTDVFYLQKAGTQELVKAIKSLESIEMRRSFERKIQHRYQLVASQKVLSDNFEKEILSNYLM